VHSWFRPGWNARAINCTDYVSMSRVARPTIGCSVRLGGPGKRAHNRVGLESGILSICGNGRDVGETGSRARNPALERNHWGQRVRVEGKGNARQRPGVADEAAGPSPDKTRPTQREARRASALPATSTVPLEVRTVELPCRISGAGVGKHRRYEISPRLVPPDSSTRKCWNKGEFGRRTEGEHLGRLMG
jgi:hypothetical protein